MRTASAALLKAMQEDRTFTYTAVITFADNTTLTLQEDDLVATGSKIMASSGSSSLTLGAAICHSLTLGIFNIDERFEDTDFFGATVHVTAFMDLGETTETLDLGTYTVTEPEQYGATVTVTAYDDFYKADQPYTTNLTFPMTAQQMYVDACQSCGLVPLSSNFANNDFEIAGQPDNVTFRQVIGFIAMLAGGNAVIKGNRVNIISYNPSALEISGTDGGIFDDGTPQYTSGDVVYGGIFNPWDTGDEVDGGTFADLQSMQMFSQVLSQHMSTDDIVITGIRIKNGENEALYGSEGYVLEMENPLAEGSEADAAQRIGTILNGMKFRSFEIDVPSYPLAEFGDIAFLVRNDKLYASYITDIEFGFKSITRLKCSADDPVRNSSKGYTAVTATERQLRQMITQEKTAREATVSDLVSTLSSGSGMYYTQDVQPDGSSIFYMHDAPTLAASHTVFKISNGAIGVTNNYQGDSTVWTFGATANGTLVGRLLDVIGINFEWGTGGTLTLGGQNNINGNLRMLNASGQEIGQWNKDGITAMNVTAYGSLICYESYTIVDD